MNVTKISGDTLLLNLFALCHKYYYSFNNNINFINKSIIFYIINIIILLNKCNNINFISILY